MYETDFLDYLNDGVMIINEQNFVIYCNQVMEDILGKNELKKNKRINSLSLYQHIKEKLHGQEHQIEIHNMTLIIKSFPARMLDENACQVIIVKDITGQKKIQQSLSSAQQVNDFLDAIIDSSYDGIFVTDSKGNGIKVNQAYTRITGVGADELLGKNVLDAVRDGTISDSVTLKVLGEKKVITIVQKVRGKEVLVTGNPIFDENQMITYVITNVRDISELNKLKTELRKSKDVTNQYLQELETLKKKEGMQLLLNKVVAHSKEIIEVLFLANKVSKVDSTTILLGESGVGKEVFANFIHTASKRAKEPYIKVNCGAIPPHLLESELFGYEKGAFTGADTRGKPGLFEQANGGTIFLDEIGELPLNLQVKLLRVLQEYELTRIGGRKTVKINVRVISATNRDLEKMVSNGEFRKDLFYRLNIIPIKIPPLRKRRDDITPLIKHFLNKNYVKYGFNKRIHPEAITILEGYHWPGNIREVENLIERLVVTVEQDIITISDLPTSISKDEVIKPQQTLKEVVQNIEKNMIKENLLIYKTTRKTAKALGISQSALVKKMKRLDIT